MTSAIIAILILRCIERITIVIAAIILIRSGLRYSVSRGKLQPKAQVPAGEVSVGSFRVLFGALHIGVLAIAAGMGLLGFMASQVVIISSDIKSFSSAHEPNEKPGVGGSGNPQPAPEPGMWTIKVGFVADAYKTLLSSLASDPASPAGLKEYQDWLRYRRVDVMNYLTKVIGYLADEFGKDRVGTPAGPSLAELAKELKTASDTLTPIISDLNNSSFLATDEKSAREVVERVRKKAEGAMKK